MAPSNHPHVHSTFPSRPGLVPPGSIPFALTAVAGILLTTVPGQAHARSPEDELALCERDANNMADRAKRRLGEVDNSNPHGAQATIGAVARDVDRLTQRCGENSGSGEMQKLRGYRQVKRTLKNLATMVDKAEKDFQRAQSKQGADAVDAGPGGTGKQLSARWSAKPKYCSAYPDPYVKEGGNRKLAASKAGWALATTACGIKIEGIDITGASMTEDRYRKLASALAAGPTGDLGMLYKGAFLFHCTDGQWPIEKGYRNYLYCDDFTRDLPSPAQFKAAATRVFKSKFERDNLTWLYDKGLARKRELDNAVVALEQRYPKLREVYRIPAESARKALETARTDHWEIVKVLDPYSEALTQAPREPAPADCAKTLLGLRGKLAAALPRTTPEDVEAFVAKHPIGYQLTEALLHCHVSRGETAQARVLYEAIRLGTRNYGLMERLFLARKQAETELEKAFKSESAIRGKIGVWPPTSTSDRVAWPQELSAGIEVVEAGSIGGLEAVGAKPEEPAIIESIKKSGDGWKISFRRHVTTHKYRDVSCHDTNKLKGFRVWGGKLEAEYERSCKHVGPVKESKIVYHPDPVVLQDAAAAGLKKGMLISVLANREAGEAALLHAWRAKRGTERGAPVVWYGVALAKK